MSRQQTIEQERAAAAWKAINQIDESSSEDLKKKYASWVRSAPADIMVSGLGQSLAFMLAKGKRNPSEAPTKLYTHLSDWTTRQMGWIQPDADLLAELIKHSSDVYRRAAVETLAYLVWLKRFAEAILPEASDAE